MWHGSWSVDEDQGSMTLQFNCRWGKQNVELKTVNLTRHFVLTPQGPVSNWIGLDATGWLIQLDWQATRVYDGDRREWTVITRA